MNKRIKIAPSILAADFSRLPEEIKAIEKAGADYIHIDVMDGHFVPNITVGPMIVETLAKLTSLPLDVHLMVSHPDMLLSTFIKAGATILTVHLEACIHLHRTLTEIKKLGGQAGVSLNPTTPLCLLEPALDYVDLVLIMSVNPGFGGQEFISPILPKIAQARRLMNEKKSKAELEVDGGIKVANIGLVAKAGADVIVSGSGIFQTPDYEATIAAMRAEISKKFSIRRENAGAKN